MTQKQIAQVDSERKKATYRQVVKKASFLRDNQLLQDSIFVLSQAKF